MFRWLTALIFFVLSCGSTVFYFDRYWKWRDCFNELGRCYDAGTQMVYFEQAGLVWATFVILFAGAGLAVLLFRRR